MNVLDYPFGEPPVPGEARQIGDDIFWVRIPLPFRLNHVNAWVLSDGDRLAIVDCGIDTPDVRQQWANALKGPFQGAAVQKILVTHGHTDHIGAAGFLSRLTQAHVEMPLTEWMAAKIRFTEHQRIDPPSALASLLKAHGVPDSALTTFNEERLGTTRYLGELPSSFLRIRDGDEIIIGGHKWRIMTFGGHADEHACMYCEGAGLLIAGDQVLPRISPVVSVTPSSPYEDPLADFLCALDRLNELPAGTLVLPGHGEPFYGLHERLGQLRRHHHERLDLLSATLGSPVTAYDAAQALFPPERAKGQTRLAFGETLAHLHHLVSIGRARSERDDVGRVLFGASPSLDQ